MRHRLVLLLVLACGPALAQAPFRIPASGETMQSIATTRVQLVLRHSEIGATYYTAPSTPLSAIPGLPGVGFLGALIAGAAEGAVLQSQNDARSKQALALTAPVRKSLEGYDLRDKFRTVMQDAVRGVAWLRAGQAKLEELPSELENERPAPDGAARLVIVARHSMSPGMRFVRLWSVTTLLAESDSLRGIAARERPEDKLPRLYRNEYLHIETFEGPTLVPAEAAKRWSENDGALVRAALDRAVESVARMMAADLAQTLPAPAEGATPVPYLKTTATILAQEGDRVILRLANGALRNVPRAFIRTGGANTDE